MNAMIKSDEFNKIHCRSHNVNVSDDNECKKANMNLKILI